MSNNYFIIGAGRHAAEVFAIAEDAGIDEHIQGFITDHPEQNARFLNKPVFSMQYLLNTYENDVNKPSVLIAIGNIQDNCRLEKILTNAGFPFFNLIHPHVSAKRISFIGKGVTIMNGCIFTVNAAVGDYSIINIGCTISHDVVIGKHVNICPGVHIAGKAIIEDEVFIGTGAVVIPNVKVGKGSIVAAGAVVTKDVPAQCMVAGVPAVIKKYN